MLNPDPRRPACAGGLGFEPQVREGVPEGAPGGGPVQPEARTAREEWGAHWPLVLATTAGFSLHPVATYATGLFIEPLNREFGWGRAQISVGLTIAAVVMVFLSPVIGALIDRWGTRALAIIGTVVTACSIASFGLANGSFLQWVLLWSVFAVVSLAAKPTVWTAAVSGVFNAGRGVALAVTLSGVAIAQILVPPLSYVLIESVGWRQSYAILGLGWGAVVLVPVVLFMYDARDHARARSAQGHEVDVQLPGLSMGEALRSAVLWRIAGATLITMFVGIGIVVHQVPILTEAGVSRQNAALLASLAGAAGIAGKLMTGWLLDRRDAGIVGSVTLAIAAVGFLLLLQPGGRSWLIVLAMIVIVYSTGAKLQISAYLTGRYGGMRNFGKIFGFVASLVALGSGLGPVLAGAIRDQFGSYDPMLVAGIVGSIASGLLALGLGPYPRWTARTG
jgi:predicted MFS family arabinose efflux permease